MRKGVHKAPPTERRCRLCRVVKPIGEFGIIRDRYFGRNYECKVCRREVALVGNIRRKYGITLAQFEDIVAKQGGGCAVCGKGESVVLGTKKTRLCVDHDHVTGKRRGILCRKCNMAIGMLNEDAELMEKAARYVRENK